MNDNREMSATTRQTISEAISDLIGRYPGTIRQVDIDRSENVAILRLHRKDSAWIVCLARTDRDA